MSSIALYYTLFTEEEAVKERLLSVSGYKIIQDADIISEVATRYSIDKAKVERTLFGPVSVFNKFTHERERIATYVKIVLADLLNKEGVVFSGLVTHFISPTINNILKVGLFDDKARRLQRAVSEGLSERQANKLIKKQDETANDLTMFLHNKQVNDPSLYDIVIPMTANDADSTVQVIMENYHKPALLKTEKTIQAIKDMALAAQVELELINKGYTPTVTSNNNNIDIQINKSVHNFNNLASKLGSIAGSVTGVDDVEVHMGDDYQISIYRAQEFSLPPKVLLVDDEQEFIQTLSDRLNTRNYGSYPVFDGQQALEFLDTETPDVMVLDLKMPGIGGVEVLQKTKAAIPSVEIIILTGHGSESDRKTCMDLGAFAYIHKPVDIKELTAIIDKAYEKVAKDKLGNA